MEVEYTVRGTVSLQGQEGGSFPRAASAQNCLSRDETESDKQAGDQNSLKMRLKL